MRKLIIVIMASSVFGGVIGALATAATQSEANPSAIAAAIQRVQDQKAENVLSNINGKLNRLGNLSQLSKLATIDADVTASTAAAHTDALKVPADLQVLGRSEYGYAVDLNIELHAICENTAPSGITCPYYAPSPPLFPG